MIEIIGISVAVSPFVVAVVALILLRWPAMWAGVAALASAVGGALLWPSLHASGLGSSLLDGLGTSAQVLYVLFGGLLLYNLLRAGGATDEVSRFLGRLEPEREALAAGVVVGVAPFFESVTGFGVAVVISAPILLAAGFPPLKAAVLASWGQCAVPWGALGVGTVIGANLADTSFQDLSDMSAYLSLPLFPVYGLAAVALAGGWAGLRRHGAEAALLGLVTGVATLVTSLFLVPELSGAVGGLAATAFFLVRRRERAAGVPVRELLPYGFLLALLAAANGIGTIAAALGRLGPVFTGPGLPLLMSSAFAAVTLKVGAGTAGKALCETAAQWLPTAGAVLTFVLAGEVVAGSGAASLLASAAGGLGNYYLAFSPVLAGLGGALTGSNAASNALFMPLQIEAARGLGLPETLTAAVQNVAGSHASMLAPQRLVLAATATGLLGREGDLARAAAAPVALALAILAWIGLVYQLH
ncbi:MAG TPA: L-lactate permease [Rubrobacteraceae bacterium]|nr:L-lactate permease [Rubrobacteraceae bacterium]